METGNAAAEFFCNIAETSQVTLANVIISLNSCIFIFLAVGLLVRHLNELVTQTNQQASACERLR